MIKLRRTGSSDLAVKLQSAKDALRIDGDNEDAVIKRYILAATSFVEKYIGTDVLNATYSYSRTGAAGDTLIFYLPENFNTPEVENGTFEMDDGLLYVEVEEDGIVTITLTAGLTDDAGEIDPDLIEAIIQLVVHFYENRDQQTYGTPVTVDYLLQPFKVY